MAARLKLARESPTLFCLRTGPFLRGAELAYNTGGAADIRRTRQIGDFANWKDHDAYQKAFERLLRDLKAESAAASE